MKKTILFIASAILLLACGKTENEQDLKDMFIGYGSSDISRNRPEIYDNLQPTQNVYSQEFNNSASSDWSNKNDDNAVQSHTNGELVIQGKKNYYTWQNVANLNQSLDFQIELRVQFNFATVIGNDTSMGIVYGVNNSSSTTLNYIYLFNNDKHTIQIGYYDGKNFDNWYAQPSNLTKNVHHIYTIRKAGSAIYIFANKKFLCKTTYKSFLSNYGFWLTQGGIISVDYVKIDYIEEKEK